MSSGTACFQAVKAAVGPLRFVMSRRGGRAVMFFAELEAFCHGATVSAVAEESFNGVAQFVLSEGFAEDQVHAFRFFVLRREEMGEA